MYLKIVPTIVLVISLFYLITSFNYYLLAVVLFFAVIFVGYDRKFYFKYPIFIALMTFLSFNLLITLPQDFVKPNIDEHWMMVSIKEETSSYYVVSYQNNYLILKKYFFNINFNLDDKLRIFGIITNNVSPNNFHQFNNAWNFYSKHISGEIKVTSKEFYHYEIFTIRNLIWKWFVQDDANNLLNYFFWQKPTQHHEPLFLLWQQLNIGHLLVTSGFHLNIQVILLNFILKKIIKNDLATKMIIFMWLGFYVYLLNWRLAVLRAFLYWTAQQINYYFKQKLLSLDILAIIAGSFLIFNPLVIYQLSYQFSFLVSAVICFYYQFFKSQNWFINKIGLQLIISVSILPITIYLQGQINLLWWFHQLIFDILIKAFYLALLILMGIKPLWFIINYFYNVMLYLTIFFSNWTIFFNLLQMPPWFYFSYYLIIVLLFYVWMHPVKNILIGTYIIWWCYWFCVPYFNLKLAVHMLNVGNALSIFIQLPHNQGNILFDAGIASNNQNHPLIFEYLKKSGINTLDAIFISHQHQDHNNNLAYLQKNINVKKVYTNKAMQKYYDVAGIRFENWAFNYYQQINKIDENNRSLVLFWKYQNHQILFTGDLSTIGENKLLKYRQPTKIDLLQVAHHGSNSSTSQQFLNLVNPKTCLISSKKTKTRNIPHPLLMQRLQNHCREIYVTGFHGTIVYQIKNYQHSVVTLW